MEEGIPPIKVRAGNSKPFRDNNTYSELVIRGEARASTAPASAKPQPYL